MKEAVPGDQPVEGFVQGHAAHVGGDPAVIRERGLRACEQGQGRVHAHDLAALFDQVAGDGHAVAAADVQHARFAGCRQQRQKARQPAALEQIPASLPLKGAGMFLVQRDHVVGARTDPLSLPLKGAGMFLVQRDHVVGGEVGDFFIWEVITRTVRGVINRTNIGL